MFNVFNLGLLKRDNAKVTYDSEERFAILEVDGVTLKYIPRITLGLTATLDVYANGINVHYNNEVTPEEREFWNEIRSVARDHEDVARKIIKEETITKLKEISPL